MQNNYPDTCHVCTNIHGRRLTETVSDGGSKVTNYFVLDDRTSYRLAITLPVLIAQEFLDVFLNLQGGKRNFPQSILNFTGSSNIDDVQSTVKDWTNAVENLTSETLKSIPLIGNELDEMINGRLKTFAEYLQLSPLEFPIIPQIVEDEDDWPIPIPFILKTKVTYEQLSNSMFKNDDFKGLAGKLSNLTAAVAIPTVLIQKIQSLSKVQIPPRRGPRNRAQPNPLPANFQKLNAISEMFNELDQNMQFFNQLYLQINNERNSSPMTEENLINRLAYGENTRSGQPIGRGGGKANKVELDGFNPGSVQTPLLSLLISYIGSLHINNDGLRRRLSKQEQSSLELGTFFQNEQDNPFSLSDAKGNFNKLFQLQKDTGVGSGKGDDETPTDFQSTVIILGEGLRFNSDCVTDNPSAQLQCEDDATINGKQIMVKLIGQDEGEKEQTENIYSAYYFNDKDMDPVISFSWKKDVSMLSGDKPEITLNDTSVLGKSAKVIAIKGDANPGTGVFGGGGNAAIIYVPSVRLKPDQSLFENNEGSDDAGSGGKGRRLAPEYVEKQEITPAVFQGFNNKINQNTSDNNNVGVSAYLDSLDWYKSTLKNTLTQPYDQGPKNWCYAAAIGSVLGDRWAIRIAKGENLQNPPNFFLPPDETVNQLAAPLNPPIDPSLLAITCEIGTTKKDNFENIVNLSYNDTDNGGFYVKNDTGSIGEICDCTNDKCERATFAEQLGPYCPFNEIKEYYGINVVCDLFVAQRGLSKSTNPCWGLVPLNAAFDFNNNLGSFLDPNGDHNDSGWTSRAWFKYLFGIDKLKSFSRPKPFIGKYTYKKGVRTRDETANDVKIWQDATMNGWYNPKKRERDGTVKKVKNHYSRSEGFGLSFGKIYSTEMTITDEPKIDEKTYNWTNKEIMLEIQTNGPIVGTMIILTKQFYRDRFPDVTDFSVAVDDDEDEWSWSLSTKNPNNNDNDNIYLGRADLKIKMDDISGYHDVSIVGWGRTRGGIDYWIVKNSFAKSGDTNYPVFLRIRRTETDINNEDGNNNMKTTPQTLDTVLCVRPRFLLKGTWTITRRGAIFTAAEDGKYIKASPGAYYFQAGWKKSQTDKLLEKYLGRQVNPGEQEALRPSNLEISESEPIWPLLLAVVLCVGAIFFKLERRY